MRLKIIRKDPDPTYDHLYKVPAERLRKPHFLVIGAQKTGTKWLYDNLNHHPDVYLPADHSKEVHFYDDNKAFPDWVWYHRHYNPKNDESIWGDITPDYACLPDRRIKVAKQARPGARIIYTLRNPKERAISQLRMVFDKTARGYGGEKPGPMISKDSDPKLMLQFCCNGPARFHGDYARNIQRWQKHFKPHQMLILPYTMLCDTPREYLDAVLGFIGADPAKGEDYPLDDRVHVSTKHDVPDELHAALDETYDPLIRDLQPLVGFDVTSWLEPSR